MNRKLLILRLAAFVLVVVALIGLVGCNKVRAIDDAVKRGDLETVKALIKANPDLVFSKDNNGQTPLHFAAGKDHMEMVKLLLTYKADINAKDNQDETPLQYAAAGGRKDLVELLLVNKADVNAKAKDGRTPLDVAATMDHKDVVELLRQHGGHE